MSELYDIKLKIAIAVVKYMMQHGAFIETPRSLVDDILSLETPNLRITLVRKEGEIPDNPYPPRMLDKIKGRERGILDMLTAGWVEEVKIE